MSRGVFAALQKVMLAAGVKLPTGASPLAAEERGAYPAAAANEG